MPFVLAKEPINLWISHIDKISVSYNHIVYWFRLRQQRFDECLYHAISTVKRTNKCVN